MQAFDVFDCLNCGVPSRAWSRHCPYCHRDGTLKRQREDNDSVGARITSFNRMGKRKITRIESGIPSLDTALGGGLVPGTVIVLHGEPGTGKSTLLAQLVSAPAIGKALFISGEEGEAQFAYTLQRLRLNECQGAAFLHSSSTTEALVAIRDYAPKVAICDSVQAFTSEHARGAPGSVAQVKRIAEDLTRLAKETGVAIVLIGQVNAQGRLAGPKKLPHWVDVVIGLRRVILRDRELIEMNPSKNRFGAAGRKVRTYLEMTAEGVVSVPLEEVFPDGVMPGSKPQRADKILDELKKAKPAPKPKPLSQLRTDAPPPSRTPPRPPSKPTTRSPFTLIRGGEQPGEPREPGPFREPDPPTEPTDPTNTG